MRRVNIYFHSYDVVHERRASVHVGIGQQNDPADPKIWLEPQIEVARPGRTLRNHELRQALSIVEEEHLYLLDDRGRLETSTVLWTSPSDSFSS